MRENRTYGLEGGEPLNAASLPLSLNFVGFVPDRQDMLAMFLWVPPFPCSLTTIPLLIAMEDAEAGDPSGVGLFGAFRKVKGSRKASHLADQASVFRLWISF